jgi:glutaminyl-tRNA synthetase
VTPEEITAAVSQIITARRTELQEERYKLVPALIKEGQKALKWAPALDVKKEVDAQVLAALGPKDERDDLKLQKAKVRGRAALPLLVIFSLTL